ncbi:MAG: type II toxin-antitoxin system VapC family toxin [Tildeniella nuda ZEHNDER 1965/U140]|jgi:tRNA(fMet)-specific endonuclease VapC|nr:type II toxin-antitoxin system VapC family toxin [Tildeniella nuda ZEHNDER 1965/U140]
MIYLLDTNACIVYLRGQNAGLIRRLAALPPSDIALCSIVKTELFYGAMLSRDPTRSLRIQQAFVAQFVSLPFDDQVALICGRIRGQLATQGIPIGPYDVQIAAIAIAHHLTLVTHNTREFSRVEALQMEDWELET